MKNRLLIVSPHPDDETLGAGGTLLKCKHRGDKIYWLNFTDLKDDYGYSSKDVCKRKEEIEKVKKIYKIDGLYNLRLKPTCLGQYGKNDLVSKASAIIKEITPQIVILPFNNDAHSDHRIVFETVFSCSKVFRHPSIKKILMMEVLSETDFASSDRGFVPNYFVDISDFLEEKIEITKIYKSEFAENPFPRSEENIRALATYRGATCGCHYAESFILLKAIE